MQTNLLIAFIGALGVLIAASAFSPLADRLARTGMSRLLGSRHDLGQVDEIDPSRRILKEDELALFAGRPLLERLFARPVRSGAKALINLGASSPEEARKRADKIAIDLRKSGHRYPSVGDFYASKILGAILFFFMGLIAILLMDLPGLFVIPLALGLLGLFLPDREVKRQIKTREEHMVTEMAFSLDRIALMMEGGAGLMDALMQLTRSPGGLFAAEIRRVMADMDLGRKPREALQAMLDRSPDFDDLHKFTNRLLLSIEEGRSIAGPLRLQADMMRSRIENEMLTRGLNATLIVTGITGAFALPALAIIIVVPVMTMAWNIL